MDEAQEVEQRQREAALADLQAALGEAERAGLTVSDCIDCGDAIPAARRQARPGATRCVACQTKRERRT